MDFILTILVSCVALLIIDYIAGVVDIYNKDYSKEDKVILPESSKNEPEQLLLDDEVIKKQVKSFVVIFCLITLCQPCFAYTKWENSPYNYNNSENNWQNSSRNWDNSPNNWNNSRYNPDANIIYDSQGQAQGYAVPKQNGTGVNVYDFNGKRQGYYNF